MKKSIICVLLLLTATNILTACEKSNEEKAKEVLDEMIHEIKPTDDHPGY